MHNKVSFIFKRHWHWTARGPTLSDCYDPYLNDSHGLLYIVGKPQMSTFQRNKPCINPRSVAKVIAEMVKLSGRQKFSAECARPAPSAPKPLHGTEIQRRVRQTSAECAKATAWDRNSAPSAPDQRRVRQSRQSGWKVPVSAGNPHLRTSQCL